MSNILKDSYDEHFALIIGINKYDNVPDLEYAVNDAEAVKNILINKFKYKEENIQTLVNEQATHNNIMDAYYNLVNDTCANDSVLFFFAGHGSTYPGLQKDKGFLIPCDGTETKMNTLISWDTLISNSELIKAKHIFFIMDACYSGLALLRGNPSKRFLKDMVRRQSRQVLTAGKADQRVKDSGAQTNNSIFTGYLLEALNGAAKTEQGVICASSVMNYVYIKVANDPNSRQTPGYGSVFGEGEFIFNYDEIFANDINLEKDNDILVEVNLDKEDLRLSDDDKLINDLKLLLPDNNNYIKITEMINKELKIYLSKTLSYKDNLKKLNNENFAKIIEIYQKDVNNLLKIVILLAYYGNNLYSNLIMKILLRITPKESYAGLLFYPLYILYYAIIITCLESNNLKVLSDILHLELDRVFDMNGYYDNRNILMNTAKNMENESNKFSIFFPEKKYKYPLSEYLYKQLQPIIDDLLYIGDEYPERYISAELLISCFYAIKKYDEQEKYVWGPLGRYTYQMIYLNKNIEDMPINKIIEEIGLYSEVSNKQDFIKKYNNFLSKFYF